MFTFPIEICYYMSWANSLSLCLIFVTFVYYQMSSQNNLELKGNLSESFLAKLLTEAAQSHIDGSFRLSSGERKSIIYLNGGEVVFAVSNARENRLFDMFLQSGKLTKEQISAIPNFANDFEFSKNLIEKGLSNSPEIEKIFIVQTENILKSALQGNSGEWVFSPFARIKESINYKISLQKILLDFARNLSSETVVKQFTGFQETFGVKPKSENNLDLLPIESFVLSRFDNSFLKITEIIAACGISESDILKTLYSLWLGGFLFRQNYQATFSERRISAILAAKLKVKREEPKIVRENISAETLENEVDEENETDNETQTQSAPLSPEDERRQLTEYLTKVRNAESLYQVLGVSSKSDPSEIKTNYLNLARKFHPDLFHREAGTDTHRQIQVAFTEIAHAYEILKDEKSRETYNFKHRKLLEETENAQKQIKPVQPTVKEDKIDPVELARKSFEEGYDYLMEESFSEALPLLARAVHLQPDNALYHAFYGKLLSEDEESRYKAEAELQHAIKLDSSKPEYRLFLAKFYLKYNLQKRAEGELQRLLAKFSDHSEALALLDSLTNK